MAETVVAIVGPCVACQATVNTPSQEPVKPTQLSRGPWENLAVDYYGPLPSGDYVLVVIDEYSRFADIDFTTSTSAKATIPKLDRIFSSYGIPLQRKSDNGAPFNSEMFTNYCKFMGIEHHTITPLHPRANGLVENFNRMVNKVIRTSTIERKCWKQELYKFLRNYRATPHVTTGKYPADLLFQTRPYRVRLPELSSFQTDDSEIRERDAKKKSQAKQYADRKRYVQTSNIQVGDAVLVRNKKKGKLEPKYDPQPYTVVVKKGTMVTASRNNPRHIITRNTSFFKRLKTKGKNNKVDEMEGDDEITENGSIYPGQGEGDKENGDEQQLEDEEPEELLQGEQERNEQERQEQENEDQEQFVPRERHGEDADAERQVVVGRPQRQRRVLKWHDKYEIEEDY